MLKYKEKYPKETVIINHKNNVGVSEARNSGLKIAKGEYISFIDSDDIVITSQYEKIFLLNKNYDLDIIMGNGNIYENETVKKECYRYSSMEKLGIISGKEMLEKMLEIHSYYGVVWLNFYKRKFLIKNNLFFYSKLLNEDILFCFISLLKAKKVKYIDIKFYLYRQRNGSITKTKTLKNEKHALFICNELFFKIKTKEDVIVINRFIFNVYWGVFKKSKLAYKKLLKKVIFLKTKSIKYFVKKIILLISYPFCKKIEKLEL